MSPTPTHNHGHQRVCNHGSQDTALPGLHCTAAHPLGPGTLCSCFDKCSQDSRRPKPQRFGRVSCTLGNYVPIVKENASCPQDRERWKENLGAPDNTTDALCVESACIQPL